MRENTLNGGRTDEENLLISDMIQYLESLGYTVIKEDYVYDDNDMYYEWLTRQTWVN